MRGISVEDVQRHAEQIVTLDAAGQDTKQLRIHLMWSVLKHIAGGGAGDPSQWSELAASAIMGMKGEPHSLRD